MAFLHACSSRAVQPKDKFQYFDLAGFINTEAARLSALQPNIDKAVFLNGKEERGTVTITDWKNELNAFRDADINKKSFLGRYAVDSLTEDGGLVIKYAALDEKFRTRELKVRFDSNNKPVKIMASVAVSNVLYSSHQHLTYEPGRGYWISGRQAVRFLEPDSFSVSARFLKPASL